MSAAAGSFRKERQAHARHLALIVKHHKPPPIKAESRAYFKALGAHITTLRKARGMTQAELARAIGVSQQAVFAYELGDRRTSVLILCKIAKVFSVAVEELIGMGPVAKPKGRLSPRAMRHAERLQALSKTAQRFVIRIIDVLELLAASTQNG